MAINFPGPYALEFNISTSFSTVTIAHKMLLSLDLQTDPIIGAAFSSINAEIRDGSFLALDTVVENFFTLIAPRYATTTTFDFVDLWRYTPLSFERTFISSYSPTVTNGSAGAGTNPCQYEMYTFRSAEGGIARLTLLESADTAQTQKGYVGLVASQQAIVDFILDFNANWILARDTSFPVSFIRASFGQNEALFRKRFR